MAGPPRDSITSKLTRMNMVVSATALVIACAAFIAYDLASFRQYILYDLSIQAQMVGSNSTSALLFDDPQSAAITLSALKAAPNIMSAGIYTLTGRPFATYWRDSEGQALALPPIPTGQTETHWSTGKDVILVRSIVFHGKPAGVVYIQSDLRRVNARLRRYMEIAAIVLGASLLAALFVSSIFRKSTAEPIVQLAAIVKTVSREKNYSLRANPSGSRDELAVLVDAFNEMLAAIQERDGALQDARSELEHRVEERTTQLTAANKELESFSYSVSHDLRAPLRAVDGFSQMLLEDCGDKLDDEGKRYLQRIRAGTQKMGSLIDDLLNLSKISRATLSREPVNLSALARAAVAALRERDPSRAIPIEIADGLQALGDARLIAIVFENLLGNAWKFTGKSPDAQIAIGQQESGNETVFFIRDTGAGFSMAHADKLFAPFQRLHQYSDFEGTGIGLATVHRIISRHGGRIWAEAAVGKGATFFFTLASNGG